MSWFSRKNHFDVEGKTVLITGGSSGMGRAVAKSLSQQRANIVIVARNQDKLAKALEYIKSHAANPDSQRFLTISADVTSAEENNRILSEVTKWNNDQSPDIIWTIAGASTPSLFVDSSIETLRYQMDMNYWSAAYLAHSAMKLWLQPSSSSTSSSKQSPRHFIMTSSTIAFVGVAGYAPYAPAKAALRSLADCLRMEQNLYNGARTTKSSSAPPADLKFSIVCPGTILSEGLENENKTKHPVTKILEADDPRQTEDQVAAAAIKGLQKGDYLVATQFLGKAMRVSSLGGSPRNGWGVVDVLMGWITPLVWLFVGPDMENKVWKYGKEHGC